MSSRIVVRQVTIFRTGGELSIIGVFGSMARGEAKQKSDIDLIVRFSKRKSLLALVRLERELSPYLHERILKEMKVVYGKR